MLSGKVRTLRELSLASIPSGCIPRQTDNVQGCVLRGLSVLEVQRETVFLSGEKTNSGSHASVPKQSNERFCCWRTRPASSSPRCTSTTSIFSRAARLGTAAHRPCLLDSHIRYSFQSNKATLTALSASMADASALRQPARCAPVLFIPHDGPSKLGVVLRDIEAAKK